MERKPNILVVDSVTDLIGIAKETLENSFEVTTSSTYKEGLEKEMLIKLIANHMKKCYLTWNREVVNDEVIFEDLKKLSGGALVVSGDLKLSESRDILAKNKKKEMNCLPISRKTMFPKLPIWAFQWKT